MDIREHNKIAWDKQVETGCEWSIPVSEADIKAARNGNWQVILTPTKPVPQSWFLPMAGLDVLCLASGGGQQGPIFAATGANVTVYDNSPQQLAQDRFVAERDGLKLTTVEGDMRDLHPFADETFDLIFHPVSNLFVPDVKPVWTESFRVLRPGGVLLAGFMNPVRYLFDIDEAEETGTLVVKYAIPYADTTSLPEARRQTLIAEKSPFEFGHTLQDQIGGQLEAGFVLTDFFEDTWTAEINDPLSKYIADFIATRALKR